MTTSGPAVAVAVDDIDNTSVDCLANQGSPPLFSGDTINNRYLR